MELLQRSQEHSRAFVVMSTKSFECLMGKHSRQRVSGLWNLFRQEINLLKHECEIGDFDIEDGSVEKIEGAVIYYIEDAGITTRKLGRVLEFFLSIPPIKIAVRV